MGRDGRNESHAVGVNTKKKKKKSFSPLSSREAREGGVWGERQSARGKLGEDGEDPNLGSLVLKQRKMYPSFWLRPPATNHDCHRAHPSATQQTNNVPRATRKGVNDSHTQVLQDAHKDVLFPVHCSTFSTIIARSHLGRGRGSNAQLPERRSVYLVSITSRDAP